MPPSQFNALLNMIPDRTLLLLKDMSSSMDLMYLYSQKLTLNFQCKDAEKEPSFNEIGVEMGKIPHSMNRMDVLVMVCMNIIKDFLPYLDSAHGFTIFEEGDYLIIDDKYLVPFQNKLFTHVYMQDGFYLLEAENTGWHFQKEGKWTFLVYGFQKSFKVFSIRNKMTLVFLQEKGVKELVGDDNFAKLKELKDWGDDKVNFLQNIMSFGSCKFRSSHFFSLKQGEKNENNKEKKRRKNKN
jgi:hypothetical protein